MGHSQQDKAATHARIVDIASKRLREKGLEGVGVADLMKEAGLTVGGFYKHFDSRDALVAEAVEASFALWKGAQEHPEAPEYSYEKLVDGYMSRQHRDSVGGGCPFAAAGPDMVRADAHTRELSAAQIQRNFDMIARLIAKQAGDDKPTAKQARAYRAQAMLAYSAMLGAVTLARVLEDEGEVKELLEGVRGQLREIALT